MHFSRRLEGKTWIIRKPGEQYCPDCIKHYEKEPTHSEVQLHAWGAVGWNFKSTLCLYEVLTNTNRKMSYLVYRDEILEKVVCL